MERKFIKFLTNNASLPDELVNIMVENTVIKKLYFKYPQMGVV